MKKFFKGLVSALYGLVMIEVLIMISPFALYWYSLYAPTLQGLHRWRATAWMEAFFLPHSVITTSRFLEFFRWQLGTYAFSLGMLAFLACAAQVYGSKLFGRGMVSSWIYSRIRHPQYLSLAVAGLGLLTIWPRIIILILYIGMLLAYYLLARVEENQMGAKHPEYAPYRARTAMFVPGNPGGKLFELFFGRIPNRALGRLMAGGVAASLALGAGLFLRRFTISHATTARLPQERILAVAVWPMPPEKEERVVAAALSDSQVRSALEKETGAVFTAHLLPADYGMVNMFADFGTDHRMFSRLSPGRFKYLIGFLLPFVQPRLKSRIMGSPQEDFKVVFSRVDGPTGHPVSFQGVTGLEAKMTPVVIANIHGSAPAVKDVVIPPRRSFWGDITMPMF